MSKRNFFEVFLHQWVYQESNIFSDLYIIIAGMYEMM